MWTDGNIKILLWLCWVTSVYVGVDTMASISCLQLEPVAMTYPIFYRDRVQDFQILNNIVVLCTCYHLNGLHKTFMILFRDSVTISSQISIELIREICLIHFILCLKIVIIVIGVLAPCITWVWRKFISRHLLLLSSSAIVVISTNFIVVVNIAAMVVHGILSELGCLYDLICMWHLYKFMNYMPAIFYMLNIWETCRMRIDFLSGFASLLTFFMNSKNI